MSAIAVYLCLYEWFLVEVFTFFFVFIYPQLWEHCCYLLWHKTAENSITSILCGSWKNTHVEVFFNVKHVANLF